MEPVVLARYELNVRPDGLQWQKHLLDDNSGVGTQFVVQELTQKGRPDIVISNKKGVFLFQSTGG